MRQSPRVTVEPHAAPAEIAAVQAGLRSFNVDRIGDPGEEPVHIFLRDGDGVIVGGLLGQARPFYEKLGYSLFGTLDGYPPGYRQFHLAKTL